MGDKYLSEKEWKNFSKNPAYKDAALVKALAALDKAEKQGPEAQISALDELDKQVDVLLKAHKGDKILANYLDEIDKAARKLRREADKALEQAADKDAEEDDEPGSALLDPKRLLAQLTLCRRDPERTVQFGFVDGKDKNPAVLALSPKVSGRKLFAKLQAETGVKTGAYGSAWVDGSSLMLQLDKPLGGLVKKVRAPVKACGFKIAKAVLWNADGTVFEQDEQDDGAEPQPPAEASATPAATVAADTPTGGSIPSAQPALEAAYQARVKALTEDLKMAIISGTPAGNEARLRFSESQVFSRNKDFPQAMALLVAVEEAIKRALAGTAGASDAATQANAAAAGDPATEYKARLADCSPAIKAAIVAKGPNVAAIAKLMAQSIALSKPGGDMALALAKLAECRALASADAPAAAMPAAPAASPAVPKRKRPVSPRVAFMQARLLWSQARTKIQAELRQLEAAILEGAKDEPDFAEIKANSGVVYEMLDFLDEGLIDKLDEALNATTDAERRDLQAQALDIVNENLDYVSTDAMVKDILNNGFVKLSFLPTLEPLLKDLAQTLDAATADRA
ncbi:MAG: hypothetical protein IV092_04175 [Burkholderiaceae bacterium]|nr:hypothetical protein [Burkholderiaceae bacterium]